MTERKKIGLALSGGAARGFAHLGVLKVLEEHQIPVDCIAGTSAGSIAGAAFASGLKVAEIIEFSRKMSWYRMSGFSYSAKGLLSNAAMGDYLRRNFPADKFEDLPVDFAAVTCDLATGEQVVLKGKGDVINAIRASCAVPGIFAPVKIDGRTLFDGGIVANVPTAAAVKLGAEIVIAVDVLAAGATFWGTPSTLIGILFQSTMLMLRAASQAHHYRADVVIVPKIAHIRPDEIGKMDELVELGERAALEKIDDIKKLLADEKNAET